MIVRGFKPVGWVAAIGAAALCCYMLSLQVAAERGELAAVERQIILARQDIRSLQTELGTRGRLQQLEQWNADVLALSAPVAGQFLESNISLARFDVRQPSLDDHARVRMASAETGAAPAARAARGPAVPATPQSSQPALRLASARVPAPVGPVAAARPLLRRASLEIAPMRTAAPAPRRASAPSPERTVERGARTSSPRAAAATGERASGLLDEATLRDLGAQARTERGGGARN